MDKLLNGIRLGVFLAIISTAIVVFGASSFVVQPNATTTDQLTIERQGENYEGFGTSTLTTNEFNAGTGTSTTTSTKTLNSSELISAFRIAEESDERASSTANVGVLYIYWNVASSALDFIYKNATGTAYLTRPTATAINY